MFLTDCSSGGQFNSITRRTKRSLDQSFVEDKYHFGYDFDAALSGTTDGYFNNSIPADIYSPPGKNSDKKFLEPLQEQMERFEHQDERIEGLEAMISKMQRTIKVKNVKCVMCSVIHAFCFRKWLAN